MRRLDWPERLAACIESARLTPFAWGTHDCVLWACHVAEALTGVDPASGFRGSYSDVRGALLVLHAIGGGGDFRQAIESVCAAHGFPPIPPPVAQRGDAVLCPSGVYSWPHALGVCDGQHAVITGPHGLVRVPMSAAIAAWRI